MSTICTSCGIHIPSYVVIYKCRQCVNHFVCELCEKKDHNRNITTHHALEKIVVPNVPSVNSVSASTRIDQNPRPADKNV